VLDTVPHKAGGARVGVLQHPGPQFFFLGGGGSQRIVAAQKLI